MADGGVRQQGVAPAGQQGDLVRYADREGIHLVGRDPGHLAVGGLGGEFDGLGVHRGGHLGHLDRLPRRLGGRVRVQVHGRGKAPGTVHHDADGQASVVGIDRALQVPVRQGDVLAPDALRAEIGVLGAQGPGLRKRRIREFPEREGGELGVDPTVLIIHGKTC